MGDNTCGIKLFGTTNMGTKGQIVIPKEIRDKLNINPGDSISIVLKDDKYIGLIKNQDLSELMEYVESFSK